MSKKSGFARPQPPGYILSDKIGSGTYADVYKAFKKAAQREVVAVKCISKSKLSPAANDNLVSEIGLLKKLKQEHLVNMKDFFWDDCYIYIVMEYCSGGDLSALIKSRRRLSEALCKRFLQHLASGLKYLRQNNVAHMDLKPQNLLLSSTINPTLKIADFGFARKLNSCDVETTLRGSPLYMAPEMLLSGRYDVKVDLWSVGVILYECLFGKAPYSSRTFEELAEKIKESKPIQLPPCSHHLSKDCEDLLLSLLQRDPQKRCDFETFFNHPFLDLEHMPSSDSLAKATNLVQKAVTSDTQGQMKEALDYYCNALKYLIPLVQGEFDVTKKAALEKKVDSYVRRAEEIKAQLFPSKPQAKPCPSNSSVELRQLVVATPALATAIDIGYAAEDYAREGQYHIALERFEMALGKLIPLLNSEPKGRRRDLLYQQAQIWMNQAEEAKALIQTQTPVANQDVDTDSTTTPMDDSLRNCRLQ